MDNASMQKGGSSLNGNDSRMASTEHNRRLKKKISLKKLIKPAIILVIVGLIVFGGLYLYNSTTSSKINTSKYQAVFLTNGQVYFGKLKIQNGGYMVLSNIYYLQTKTNTDDKGNVQAAAGEDATNVELVKLGAEIHGPIDEMIINVDQVLFFENLKEDGNLTQSIIKFEADK